MSALPREITVTRWVCPFCHRGRSKRAATEAHIARCWRNPAAKACTTCVNFIREDCEPDVGYPGGEYCAAGVDLSAGPVPRSGCGQWAEVPA
jgi:hypothetical protein